MAKYEFHENNSGGSFWLDREQYKRLFEAGFYIEENEYAKARGYYEDDPKQFFYEKEVPYGWRSALVVEAHSAREAIREWEDATGENFFAGGCPCCGPPFSMQSVEKEDGDKWEYYTGGYEEMTRPF